MKPDELTNGTKPVLKKQSRQRKEERKQQRMNDGNNDEFSAAKKKGKGGGGTKEACLPSDVHVRHVLVCVCMYTITKSREEEKIVLRINKMSEKKKTLGQYGVITQPALSNKV